MYDNGVSTRRAILDACKKLFYQKGFHETSYDDICREAHVNRGSIYYHFREKEQLRYEVTWETFIANRHLAEKYCPERHFSALLSLYMLWHQVLVLPQIRQFHLAYCRDCPVFDPNLGLPRFYMTVYEHSFSDIRERKTIGDLAFATVYGHLMGMMQLVCDQPESYRARELFMHGIKACTMIWGIPDEEVQELWIRLEGYIDRIPLEEIEAVMG